MVTFILKLQNIVTFIHILIFSCICTNRAYLSVNCSIYFILSSFLD